MVWDEEDKTEQKVVSKGRRRAQKQAPSHGFMDKDEPIE